MLLSVCEHKQWPSGWMMAGREQVCCHRCHGAVRLRGSANEHYDAIAEWICLRLWQEQLHVAVCKSSTSPPSLLCKFGTAKEAIKYKQHTAWYSRRSYRLSSSVNWHASTVLRSTGMVIGRQGVITAVQCPYYSFQRPGISQRITQAILNLGVAHSRY